MIDRTDSSLLWVDQNTIHNGSGSFEAPYVSLELALQNVQPGNTIVLAGGTYESSSTIQVSGTIESPIVILGDDQSEVVVKAGCWYLYDASDLIISNITFRDCLQGAISVVGRCRRNRFSGLRFFNCGTENSTSSTLFFGGSGAQCNVVEQCYFEHAPRLKQATGQSVSGDLKNVSIGLMLSEGDANRPADVSAGDSDDFAPNVNHLIRRNAFVNYDYGLLLGSSQRIDREYGTIVEHNLISSCTHGIVVYSGDTALRGNTVKLCSGDSIAVLAGRGSVIADSRIVDCGRGIRIRGLAHSVNNNCLVRCAEMGVRLECAAGLTGLAARSIVVEHNTFVDCGASTVVLEAGTSGVIQNNLAHSAVDAVFIADTSIEIAESSTYLLAHNGVAGMVKKTTGAECAAVEFADPANDNFTNQSGFGASGWMLCPQAYDPDAAVSSPRISPEEIALAAEILRARAISPGTSGAIDADEQDDPHETDSILEQSFFFNHSPNGGNDSNSDDDSGMDNDGEIDNEMGTGSSVDDD